MRQARTFFFVSLGILALAGAFHLGARSAQGQVAGSPIALITSVEIPGEPGSRPSLILENGDVWAWFTSLQPTLTTPPEFVGNLFSGYASANGVDWVTCGTAFVSMGDPVRVGLHALCPGNMPPTVTRFDYFKLLKRPTEAPLMDSRLPASFRTPDYARRRAALRNLT